MRRSGKSAQARLLSTLLVIVGSFGACKGDDTGNSAGTGGGGGSETPDETGAGGSNAGGGGATSSAGDGGASSPEQEAEMLANEVAMLAATDAMTATAATDYLAGEVLHDAVQAETTSNKALDFSSCAGRWSPGAGGASGDDTAEDAGSADDDMWSEYCVVELDELELPLQVGGELRFSGRVGYKVDYPNGIYILADLQSDAPDAPSEVHVDLMVDFFNARYELGAENNKVTIRSPERRYSWVTNPPAARLDQICHRYEQLATWLEDGGAGMEFDTGDAASTALDTLGRLCSLAKTPSDYQKPTTTYFMIDELGLGSDKYLGRLTLGYAESPESFRQDVDGVVVYWGRALDGVIESVERTDMALKLIDWPVIQTQPRAEGMCLAVNLQDGAIIELAEAIIDGNADDIDVGNLQTIDCPQCIAHAECEEGRICDSEKSICVTGCFNDDDCGTAERCQDATPPDVPGKCSGLDPICNPADPNSCESGTCEAGRCVAQCSVDDTSACADQQLCDNERCVDCTADAQGVCTDQQVCHENQCVQCTEEQTQHCSDVQYCFANRCIDRCTLDSQCEEELIDGIRAHCFITSGECVISCNNALNRCLDDQTCDNDTCQDPQ